MNGWTDGLMDDMINGGMFVWVDELMDGRRMDGWKDRQAEGCKEERVEGGTDEWKEV